MPEPDSSIYLEGVRKGGTLLTAKADGDRMQRAAEIMSGYNMVNIQDRAPRLARGRTPTSPK